MSISPSMFKSVPDHWGTDFTPVSHRRVFDFVIVPARTVRSGTSATSSCRQGRPDKFNFGTISVGSAQNLSALMFASMAGLSVTVGAVPHDRRGRDGAPVGPGCRRLSRPCRRHRAGAVGAICARSRSRRSGGSVPAGVADRRRKRGPGYQVCCRGTASWCRRRRRATSCSRLNKELATALATPRRDASGSIELGHRSARRARRRSCRRFTTRDVVADGARCHLPV